MLVRPSLSQWRLFVANINTTIVTTIVTTVNANIYYTTVTYLNFPTVGLITGLFHFYCHYCRQSDLECSCVSQRLGGDVGLSSLSAHHGQTKHLLEGVPDCRHGPLLVTRHHQVNVTSRLYSARTHTDPEVGSGEQRSVSPGG